METGQHWNWSCRINGCLFGRWDEPLCSRAWRRSWQRFIDAMQIAWRDPVHCEDVHLRWLVTKACEESAAVYACSRQS